MKGKFIAIEGIDGCGKSTHARLLARWLRSKGYRVVVTDEPTNGPIGRVIKRVLHGELKVPVAAEALLFAADRLHHAEQLISPALRKGKIVITERYFFSSLAYQTARRLPAQWITKLNERAPVSDLAVLIDVPAYIALGRIEGSRKLDAFEKDLKLQRKVRAIYLQMVKKRKLKIVDGARVASQVQADLRKLVQSVL